MEHTEAEKTALMKTWASHHGLKLHKGNRNWAALVKPPYKKPKTPMQDHYGPGDDHCSLWYKDGKPYCWVSQPYGLRPNDLLRMMAHANLYGLDFTIGSWPAWYYPGRVLFVVWKRKD